MLTKISIKNFKKLDAEIELDDVVVFVGPNNSGKTTALQAISLWELALRKWADEWNKYKSKNDIEATINRYDVFNVPVPQITLLWRNNLIRSIVDRFNGGKTTKQLFIDILAEGSTKGKSWRIGFQFEYANPESIKCRISTQETTPEMIESALQEKVGSLQPAAGLSLVEDKLERGSINNRIGQGRTAEIIRNLCWTIYEENEEKWNHLVKLLDESFRIHLNPPMYNPISGQIVLMYNEGGHEGFDLICAGRGFHQMLLLTLFLYANQNTVLLIDEPDAHLEVIRQAESYHFIRDFVRNQGGQLIVATHSEKLLSEAVDKDMVVSFNRKPHVVNNKQQVVKSLTTIGFDQYVNAEQNNCILYLEGPTDLAILRSFAEVLNHPVAEAFKGVPVKYVSNNPADARSHFHALLEAIPDLKGLAVFDNITKRVRSAPPLREMMWKRNEIENYLPLPQVLERYIKNQISLGCENHNWAVMKEVFEVHVPPIALSDTQNDFWVTTKISDKVLDSVFREYFKRLAMPMRLMQKGKYYELARFSKAEELNPEISEKLDAIWEIIQEANRVPGKRKTHEP
jgi:predicted ATPase